MQQNKLRTIHLFGSLRNMCGGAETVELGGNTMPALISGLTSRYGNHIKAHIAQNNWQLFLDKDEGDGVEQDHAQDDLGDVTDIYLYPAIEGAGKVGNVILGIVLIVVGVLMMFVPGGQPAGAQAMWTGASYVIGGAMMIYTALNTPKAQQVRAQVDERASFIFNGAANVIEQGGAVPLVYGRFRTGSTVVSAGIDTEQISHYNSNVGTNSAPNSLFGITDI